MPPPEASSSQLWRFLRLNLLAVAAFPAACLVAVVLFWKSTAMGTAAIATVSGTHVFILWRGLCWHGHAVRVAIPSVCAAIAVFTYNRHWNGQPDLDNPFTDGLGTVGQHVYGVFTYYRVFDYPFEGFGETHIDWLALFMNVELCVAVTIIFAAVSGLIPRQPTPT